jgi:hypothetical protein
MTDTEIVPRKREREPADRPPLVDAALADELLARAQTDGVELREQAEQVRQLLINHGFTETGGNPGIAVQTNTGQIVQNTGSGVVHAPFRVDGNYTAAPEPGPAGSGER